MPTVHSATMNLDWRTFLLVTGEQGMGKSYVIIRSILMAPESSYKVLVATPTGFLSTDYGDKFGDSIDTDTIHAAFRYPVPSSDRPVYNWNIANYDLIVIDKLSIVPRKIFDHVMSTISVATK